MIMHQIAVQREPSSAIKDQFDSSISLQKLNRRHRRIAESPNYRILWLESGIQRIDGEFGKLTAYPNSIIFLYPGKALCLRFGAELPKGWILRFSRDFLRQQDLSGFNIQHADLFLSVKELPCIVLSPKIGERVNTLAEMINEVMQSAIPNKELAASSLLSTLLVYCDSKCNIRIHNESNNHYLSIVSQFKQLVAKNLTVTHRVAEYAEKLYLSPKYLNNVVKEVMGITAKDLIKEQLLIRACRELKFTNLSVKEVAFQLGFSEPEHFSNFFKKETGLPPGLYRQK